MGYVTSLGITPAINSGHVSYYACPLYYMHVFPRYCNVRKKNRNPGINTVKTPAAFAVGFIYAYVIKHIKCTKFVLFPVFNFHLGYHKHCLLAFMLILPRWKTTFLKYFSASSIKCPL